MKTINLELSVSSIDKAIKQLKRMQSQINEMIPILLKRCCQAIINQANINIDMIDIPVNIKEDIKKSWECIVFKNKVIIKNYSDKAVYIEFGVGLVGETYNHPKAEDSGYEYNLPSKYKRADNHWMFWVKDLNDIDLIEGNYTTRQHKTKPIISVQTKGSPATMFVFQSILDFIESGETQKIWGQVKKEFWG